MTVKIDKIDKKVLTLLLENCRFSNAYIAKCIKISEQVIKYRIERLEKEGVILEYKTQLMNNAIGVNRYFKFYLKIKNTKLSEKQAILSYLNSNPFVSSLFECDGVWNISFIISAAWLNHVKPIIFEVQKISEGSIEDLKVFNICHSDDLQRKVFLDDTEEFKCKTLHLKDNSFKKELTSAKNVFFSGIADLDRGSLKILKLTINDARMPMTEIAKKANINVLTAKRKISNMIEKGIIKGFSIVLDYGKLDLIETELLISVLTDESIHRKIKEYVRQRYKQIEIIYGYMDYWNMSLFIVSENPYVIDEIADDLMLKFNNIIHDVTKLRVTTYHKKVGNLNNLDKIYSDIIELYKGRIDSKI